jgi:hypothetical protein
LCVNQFFNQLTYINFRNKNKSIEIVILPFIIDRNVFDIINEKNLISNDLFMTQF